MDSPVGQEVLEQNERLLATYRADPRRLEADANQERSLADGAYAQRQLFELVQNAADAMHDTTGFCEVVLTDNTLYVANSGAPFDTQGVRTLMATNLSGKGDDRIGRFGLGFKSVLAVSDRPAVISRTGSFRFDRPGARSLLAREFPGSDHYPGMRTAEPFDPEESFRTDPVLAGFAARASTVVVAPLARGRDILARGLAHFPGEFLLFSPHVQRLDLEDRAGDTARRITLSAQDSGTLVLTEGGKQSRWVVEAVRHSPGREALADGGYQAARESIEVTWAAPVAGATQRVGTMWAYFPTADYTTLSGILNAPWKLADDRESLLAGAFNEEILTRVVPGLVARALPRVHSAQGAGAVIDLLPARGKESRSLADDLLNSPVMDAVASAPSIPTMAGTLRHPTRVRLHPEGLDSEDLALWASAVKDPEHWAHHELQSTERRSKVSRLMATHQRTAETVKKWVEHLVATPDAANSSVAVRLVSQLSRRRPELRAELESARVLLLEDGTLYPCRRGRVFLPGEGREPGRLFIDATLAGDREVVAALNAMGIELLNDEGTLRAELSADEITWDRVWTRARVLTVEEAVTTFHEELGEDLHERLRVRSLAGRWRGPGHLYMPGPVVPGDGSRDQDLVVHPTYHQQDMELLQRLGLVERPTRSTSPPTTEVWMRAAQQRARDSLRRTVGKPRMQDESIRIETGRVFWPLEPLKELSPAGRAAVTHEVLGQSFGDEKWTLTERAGGPKREMRDPVYWHLREHGALNTSVGPWPVAGCLAPLGSDATADAAEQPLPHCSVPMDPTVVEALNLADSHESLRAEDWERLIALARPWDSSRRTLAYAWAADAGHPAPEKFGRSGAGGTWTCLPQTSR
ncbi:sacsin N-terminal ATP-binding-like domain-containing protein [Serinicoccus marinus]|uniref:sacsin N-terminal ATP-binding-like domain-containing protein n=1 Tax=Serinicoccus marinus TaxID=247333 RepID=UPI002491EBAE|nr:hypothetical protein [Serinicoccus marinus]